MPKAQHYINLFEYLIGHTTYSYTVMFDDLLSINFMLIVLIFVFASVIALNILAAITSFILSLIIKAKKL